MRRGKQLLLTIPVILAIGFTQAAHGRIPWETSWQEASSLAHSRNQLVLIHFASENCPPCLKLEQTVFSRPDVRLAISSNYVPLRAQADQNNSLARRYHINRVPTDVIVTPQGREVFRKTSPQDPHQYMTMLDEVAAHTHINASMGPNSSPGVAAASEGGTATSRTSTFPPGPVSSTSGTAAAPANSSSWTPSTGPTADPMGPQSPRLSAQTGPHTAADQTPGLGSPAANPYTEGASDPATPRMREQQASYQSNSGGEFRLPGSPPTHAPSSPAKRTTNHFVTNNARPRNQASSRDAPTGSQPATSSSAAASPPAAALALNGYCSVTLIEQEKWVKGDSRWGVRHRGQIYLFVGPEEQQRFLANYDTYAPALSGFDCVRYAEQGELAEGKREHGIFYGDQIFLFADETALNKFCKAPSRYLSLVEKERARQAGRGR